MKAERRLLHLGAALALLAAWEASSRAGWADPFFVGSPTEAAAALLRLLRDPAFPAHARSSLGNLLCGYLLGAASGACLGAAAGAGRSAYEDLKGYARAAYTVPQVVLIPFLVIWFGIGDATKIAVVFLMTFFPVFVGVMEAARRVDRELRDVCRVYGAGAWTTYSRLVLPACVPAAFGGAKIAVPRAVAGMILGETFGRAEGLGYLLFHHGALYAVNDMLAVLGLILALSLGLYAAVDAVEIRAIRWEP